MLIDNHVKSALLNTLSGCHETRVKLYTTALNVVVLIALTICIFLTLYYCYQRRPNAYETRKKMLKDQDYILSKIRFYQAEQKNLMLSPIGVDTNIKMNVPVMY